MSRARGVSFGDMRNIVCLCQRHHGYFKEQNDRLYWELTEEIIGPARWEWIKRVEREYGPQIVIPRQCTPLRVKERRTRKCHTYYLPMREARAAAVERVSDSPVCCLVRGSNAAYIVPSGGPLRAGIGS